MGSTRKKMKPQPPVNTMSGAGSPRPFTPAEQIKQLQRQVEHAAQRTDIERVAAQVAELVERICNRRSTIKSLKNELEHNETQLNSALLEHQIAVAKFKELGAVPQPTA